ncbi:MAG: LysR family transcriptional regulator [Thermodesulfobacteriota bacterium]
MDNRERFRIRSKIWIEDANGQVVFGNGRYRMLMAIDRHRSLQMAARELQMSYRALWGRVKASEERLGRVLVVREGRGSCLTPFARELLASFARLEQEVRDRADQAYAGLVAGGLR